MHHIITSIESEFPSISPLGRAKEEHPQSHHLHAYFALRRIEFLSYLVYGRLELQQLRRGKRKESETSLGADTLKNGGQCLSWWDRAVEVLQNALAPISILDSSFTGAIKEASLLLTMRYSAFPPSPPGNTLAIPIGGKRHCTPMVSVPLVLFDLMMHIHNIVSEKTQRRKHWT
ncbi:hypothetical protein HK102_008074 [Quaeritorhiza haematococci]|nr:hypothetical protein HK102_008074 [Quaeritorhiza haematococci]